MKAIIATILLLACILGAATLIILYPMQALVVLVSFWILCGIGVLYWYAYDKINSHFEEK